MKLEAHPRLYISARHYANLEAAPDSSLLETVSKQVTSLAKDCCRDYNIYVDETGHNFHLIRTREMQTRIVTLLVEWKRTRQPVYRRALLDYVTQMNNWEYWSWIAWRESNRDPNAVFDLSCGENSATLAIAFDALHGELSRDEIAMFVEMARRRSLQPYLHHMRASKRRPWYYNSPNSNWNTVCNGGAGMLALAMAEYLDEAAEVVKLVEAGIRPYFASLGKSGAWPEGIGYWNYGMRYGFMYLLSHERATGKPHQLMQQPGTRATLRFPLAFSPNDVPCSFGDVNRYTPLPFHLLAARQMGQSEIAAELEERFAYAISQEPKPLKLRDLRFGAWPVSAELLLFYSRQPSGRSKVKKSLPHGELLDGLQWGYLGNRMPSPSLYISVRGGTIDAPHTHRDLLSFFCLVNREKLIDNVPVDDYLDSTFGTRREELYEVSSASKNTVFINGVGIQSKSAVATSWIRGKEYEGFRFDATASLTDTGRSSPPLFCGRLIIMLQKSAILVVDRIELSHAGLFESRLHTFQRTKFEQSAVLVSGKKEKLHLSFAASKPAILKRGLGTPTQPTREADTMIRYLSAAKVHDVTMAYLLTPNGQSQLKLTEGAGSTLLEGSGDVTFRLKLSHKQFDFARRA